MQLHHQPSHPHSRARHWPPAPVRRRPKRLARSFASVSTSPVLTGRSWPACAHPPQSSARSATRCMALTEMPLGRRVKGLISTITADRPYAGGAMPPTARHTTGLNCEPSGACSDPPAIVKVSRAQAPALPCPLPAAALWLKLSRRQRRDHCMNASCKLQPHTYIVHFSIRTNSHTCDRHNPLRLRSCAGGGRQDDLAAQLLHLFGNQPTPQCRPVLRRL